MKISDLKVIKDVTTRVARSDSSSGVVTPVVVHIVDRNGSRDHSLGSRIYHLTRCNRAMRYTWRVSRKHMGDKKLCARCGTRKEFETVQDDWYENQRAWQMENKRRQTMELAEWKASEAWDQTYQELNDGIAEYADELAECGDYLIPMSQWDIDLLRIVLGGFIETVERKSMKDEELVQAYHHVKHILDEVLIT